MRITPLDIRKQEFRKAMRGLDAEEVYAFLSTVGDEYEAVLNDNKALRERLLELDDKVQEYRSLEKTLRDTLLTAERVTVEARENARREAALIVKEAQIEAEKALRDINGEAMALRQDVSKLRSQRESYFGRMRVIAESLLKFIGSIEDDFQQEDEAFKDEIPEDVTREETALADPPPDRGDLFNPADSMRQNVIPETKQEAVPEPGRDEAPIPREEPPASNIDTTPAPADSPAADAPVTREPSVNHEPLVSNEPDPPVAVAEAPSGEDINSESLVTTATAQGNISTVDDTRSAMSDINDIIERMADGQQQMLSETQTGRSIVASQIVTEVPSDVSTGAASSDPHFKTIPALPETPSGMVESNHTAIPAAGNDESRAVPVGSAWERVSEAAAVQNHPIETHNVREAAGQDRQNPVDTAVQTVPEKPVDVNVTTEMSFEEIRKSLESRLSAGNEENR